MDNGLVGPKRAMDGFEGDGIKLITLDTDNVGSMDGTTTKENTVSRYCYQATHRLQQITLSSQTLLRLCAFDFDL